jgi:tetratricopeptide (TPR) repeat protein
VKHTNISLTLLAPFFLTLTPLSADTVDDLNTILGSATPAKIEQTSDSLPELPEAFQYALDFSNSLFSDPLLRADSQFSLALALCEKGHTDAALDVLRKITSFHSAQGLGAIALKLAKQGDTDKARPILSEAIDKSETLLGWKRGRALTEIAETQAVLQDLDAADTTVAKVTEELDQIRIKARVAAAIAIRTGEPGFEKDMKLVGSEEYYPEAVHQSRPFYAAAVYFAKSNELEKAKTLFLEAAEIAAAANNNTHRNL